jgi:hypothetical protein
LDVDDGRDVVMQRFLADSVTYAESGYAGSCADAEEFREGITSLEC